MKKVAKTPYKIKALLKAKRSTRLMKEGYAFRNTEEGIIEVNAFGVKLNPIELALLEGVGEEELQMLLTEREKYAQEWIAKKNEEKSEKSETVD